MTGLFGFFGLDKDTEGEVESSDKGFKSYLESLDVSNTEKFKKHTGWKPEINFETTMKDLLEYWRGRVRNNNYFLSR